MKNYNIFALQGDMETSDAEVCETLGIDPTLAGTPAINEAAIKAMHRKNYDGFVNKGVDSNKAMLMADERAATARATVKQAMK